MEPQIQQEPLKKCGGGGRGRSASGCFDCSICLDFAVDPVVTLCGHLYCWPCIYKWLKVETISPQQCPVCKASLSQDSLVPLYGRGGHNSSSSKHSYHHTLLDIPQRPNSCVHNREDHTEVVEPQSQITTNDEDPYITSTPVHEHTWSDYNLSAPPSPSSRVIHSTAGGVLGEMASAVLPWVLRDHHQVAEAASVQFSSSPYYVAGSHRLRRQEMEVQSSLRQIWLFLFCCAMLCLLLF